MHVLSLAAGILLFGFPVSLVFLPIPQQLNQAGPPGLQNNPATPTNQTQTDTPTPDPYEQSTRPPRAYEAFRQTVAREPQARFVREKYLKSADKGLSLLVQSAANYPKHRQCFSCHHQTLPLFALHIADPGTPATALHLDSSTNGSLSDGNAIEAFSFKSLRNDLKNTRPEEELDGRGLTLGYGMWLMDLSLNLHPDDKLALIRKAIATQQPQGHWRIHSHRPPAASSQAIATALIVSSFAKHITDLDLPETERQAMHQAIFRAMVWYLREEEPKTTEDACGMLWLGSAFRNYVHLDRKATAHSLENSESPWALQSTVHGPLNGNLHLNGDGPPGLGAGLMSKKQRYLELQDQELFRASRLPPEPQNQQQNNKKDRQANYRALASMVGLANSNLMLNKYARPDTGELRLATSPHWRAWLKENYSNDEIVSLFRADRRRGLHDAGRKLIDLQNTDGGWPQTPDQESDPYSTGMCLIVLKEVYSDLENYGGDNAWELQRFITKRYLRLPPKPLAENWWLYRWTTQPTYPRFEFEHRALKYLLTSQKKDGSWHVSSRATPVQEFFDNGDPHETDQFISIMATAWATAALANAWFGQPAPLSY